MQPAIDVKEKIASYGRPLTVEELASCLGFQDQLVRKYARKKVIPCFRLGTAIRFNPREVCKWIDKQ